MESDRGDKPQGPEVRLHPDDPVSRVLVRFEGLKLLQPQTLIQECASLGHVRTLWQVQAALEDARGRLEELRVFKSLQTDVTVEQGGVVNVAFVGEERNRTCTVGANVDKRGEMSFDVKLEQPLLLGRPLSATGSLSSTASRTHEFSMGLHSPRFLGRRWNLGFDVARVSMDETLSSSCSEEVTHATVKLSGPSGGHTIAAGAALRDLHPATASARWPSQEVQKERLRSVKTSMKYSFSWALRQHPAIWAQRLVLNGVSATARADVEAAGFTGDVHFIRSEARAAGSWPLPLGLSLHAGAACGLLLPTDGKPSCLQDRFFLGGPSGTVSSVLKGFAHRGAGPIGQCLPRDPHNAPQRCVDSLGGDAILNAFTAVSMPLELPQAKDLGLRLHGSLGIGSVLATGAWKPQAGLGALLGGFRGGTRASLGVGVGLPLAGGGTLELTFAQPLLAQSHDTTQRWQLGLRLDFGG